jgi:general secretion pathway protein K
MKLRSRAGSVIIVSLWAMMFLAFIAAGLAVQMRSQISMAGRISKGVSGRTAAYSGIGYVTAFLNSKDSASPRNSADWTADPDYFTNVPVAGSEIFSVGYSPAPGKDFIYGLEDQEQKINLNKAGEDALTRLLASFPEAAANAAHYAKEIVAWRDRAENFEELSLKGAAAGFGSVEELLLVPGITEEIWKKISPSLTVYSSGRVNLNTVPTETLVLLGIDPGLAARIADYRKAHAAKPSRLERPASGPAPAQGAQEAFTDLGDLKQKIGVSPEEDTQLQNLASLWAFRSQYFRFLSLGAGEIGLRNGFECVVDSKGRLLSLRNARG